MGNWFRKLRKWGFGFRGLNKCYSKLVWCERHSSAMMTARYSRYPSRIVTGVTLEKCARAYLLFRVAAKRRNAQRSVICNPSVVLASQVTPVTVVTREPLAPRLRTLVTQIPFGKVIYRSHAISPRSGSFAHMSREFAMSQDMTVTHTRRVAAKRRSGSQEHYT